MATDSITVTTNVKNKYLKSDKIVIVKTDRVKVTKTFTDNKKVFGSIIDKK